MKKTLRERWLQRLKLGDKVEALAKPIAVAMKKDCLDENNNLKENTPCWKRKQYLNGIDLSQDLDNVK